MCEKKFLKCNSTVLNSLFYCLYEYNIIGFREIRMQIRLIYFGRDNFSCFKMLKSPLEADVVYHEILIYYALKKFLIMHICINVMV